MPTVIEARACGHVDKAAWTYRVPRAAPATRKSGGLGSIAKAKIRQTARSASSPGREHHRPGENILAQARQSVAAGRSGDAESAWAELGRPGGIGLPSSASGA